MGEPRFNKNKRYVNKDGKKFGKGVWEGYGRVIPPGWGDFSRKDKTVTQYNTDGTKSVYSWEQWQKKKTKEHELKVLQNDRKYSIPYIPSKKVTISIDKSSPTRQNAGATFSENLLDSIAVNAKKAGLPFSTALGIAAQESTIGHNQERKVGTSMLPWLRFLNSNLSQSKKQSSLKHYQNMQSPSLLISNWKRVAENPFYPYQYNSQGYLLSEPKEMGYYEKDFNSSVKKGNNYQLEDVSPLYHGFKSYKESPNKYNPGDPNYPDKVKSQSQELTTYSPEIRVYMKKHNLHDNGGNLNNTWDSLSLGEKAEMMKVAIANGITTLPEIKESYNAFSKGGDKNQSNSEIKQDIKDIVNNISFSPEVLRNRFYRHFDPYSAYTDDAIKRAFNLAVGGPDYAKRKYPKDVWGGTQYTEGAQSPFDDAVWGTYLNIPLKDRKYKTGLTESKYKPTVGEGSERYYTVPISNETKKELVYEGSKLGFNQNTNTKALFGYNMGTSTIGRGIDDKGEYVSYYDKWDINPLHGDYVSNNLKEHYPVISRLLPKDGSDAFRGFTTPVSFYDRIYLDDYYGIKSSLGSDEYYGGYLPEVTVTPRKFAKGGKTNNASGGYVPSERVKKDIATWEGASMKTNRSFEAEAKDFNNVIPSEVRKKLSGKQLDALYSYGYNVGMGNLQKRVVPTLMAYTQGKATEEDVQRSMWASRDNELRGLTRRRNWEREKFGGNYRSQFTGTGRIGVELNPSSYELPSGLFDAINTQIDLPQMQFPESMSIDPESIYKPPVIKDTHEASLLTPEEVTENSKQDRLERVRTFNTVMELFGGGSPLVDMSSNDNAGLLSYIGQIYK